MPSTNTSITLNTGAKIPVIGFGTWQPTREEAYKEEAYNSVLNAIKAGYRHIDTAFVYGNEEYIGRAIRDSKIPRSELYVTTKLWTTGAMNPLKSLQGSLDKLGLDYVDLYLMHWPVTLNPKGNDPLFPVNPDGSRDIIDESEWSYIDTYKKMEELLKTGKVKSIGVCNFTVNKLEKLLDETTIIPAILQVELHPLLPQQDLVDFCLSKDIVVEAYSPLGSTGAPLLKTKELIDLAAKYNVSPANICISWEIWRNVIPLPKSSKPDRIISNLKVVDLSNEDGEIVSNLYKTHGVTRFINPDWNGSVFD